MITFKSWVESHNPSLNWNWDNPTEIKSQLIEVVRTSGNLNLEEIFAIMFLYTDSGLTVEQNQRFGAC